MGLVPKGPAQLRRQDQALPRHRPPLEPPVDMLFRRFLLETLPALISLLRPPFLAIKQGRIHQAIRCLNGTYIHI
ncbi:hypothetical protein L3X38_001584 [Prunus dulcis]|uniref:Uncharacterized protein n=1 Tax=Prunus dulcis TaxID=3755 RepID=A0AAD4ZJ57_PRUDU|nr:hypothetical protein L3X38_001584 [Prunus dulcis]